MSKKNTNKQAACMGIERQWCSLTSELSLGAISRSRSVCLGFGSRDHVPVSLRSIGCSNLASRRGLSHDIAGVVDGPSALENRPGGGGGGTGTTEPSVPRNGARPKPPWRRARSRASSRRTSSSMSRRSTSRLIRSRRAASSHCNGEGGGWSPWKGPAARDRGL